MIVDAREIPSGSTITCDVVIVGSGPAGIPASLRLAQHGADVVLLEAGGQHYSTAEQNHFQGDVVDETVHHPLDQYRLRQLGGGSNLWGGRCAPFEDIDMAERDWVPFSGWPIGNKELEPFYSLASDYLDTGALSYDVVGSLGGAKPFPGVPWHRVSDRSIWRYSLPTNMRQKYRTQLKAAQNIRTLLHASCVEIEPSLAGNVIERVKVATSPTARISIRAKQVILACGALETARLLLASRSRHAAGIGNAYDQVGRYYQTHLYGSHASVTYRGNPQTVGYGFRKSNDGVYVQHMLKLAAEVQRENKLMNFCVVLNNRDINDPAHASGVLSGMHLAKWMLSRRLPVELVGQGMNQKHRAQVAGTHELRAHLRNIALDLPNVAGFAAQWAAKRILAKRKLPGVQCYAPDGQYFLLYSAEQEPNPASRITLADRMDAFGYPRAKADWRYTERDIASIVQNHAILAHDIEESAGGMLTHDIDLASLESRVRSTASVGSHHIGTARISNDPRKGVVDERCRVHGIANLYVAGSATFPTSSCMSVTLLITALSLRVADSVSNNLRAA